MSQRHQQCLRLSNQQHIKLMIDIHFYGQKFIIKSLPQIKEDAIVHIIVPA